MKQEDVVDVAAQRMSEVVGLQRQLQTAGYIAERPLAAALLLMLDLGRPLLLKATPVWARLKWGARRRAWRDSSAAML